MDQETLFRASQLEKAYNEYEEQLQFINQQISELEEFQKNLTQLAATNEKRMLAPLGKGVYAKTDLVDKTLFVEVGAGVIVRKSPEETRDIIESQIKKFVSVRAHLVMQLEGIGQDLTSLMQQLAAQEGKR